MLRAMLVDDEPLALEGLRLLIDWEAQGFAVCAECAGASQALDALPAAEPDLIVTDIRMPGMDGLRLMEAARALGFDGEFIIVSGYGEFDYAQKALQIGVAGYLLKPVDPDEAAEALAQARERLSGRARCTGGNAGGKPVPGPLEGLEGALPAAGWRCRLGTWGAPLPAPAVRALLSCFPAGAASVHIEGDREYLALKWRAGEKEPGTGAAAVLLAGSGRELVLGDACRDAGQLRAQRDALDARLDKAAAALPEKAAELARAIALRDAGACESLGGSLERLCDACGAGARARVRAWLAAECAGLLAGRPAALQAFLGAEPSGLKETSLEAVRLLAPEQELVSRRAMSLIEPRLTEPWTLEAAAGSLGYNATYLGRVFREEQGMGFHDWLDMRRAEWAAMLLRDTGDTAYAVAERAGFTDYRRFLKHFKRRYGMTPDRYRKSVARI